MRKVFLGVFVLVSLLSSAAWGQVSVSPSPSTTGNYTVSWPSNLGNVFVLEEKNNSGSRSIAYQGSATQVALSGKTNGSYEYEVFDEDGAGCNPWIGCVPSSVGTVTVTVALAVSPGTPGAISAPSVSSGSYQTSWSAASGDVDSYQLQEAANGGAWNTVQNTSAMSKSFSKSQNNYYDYRVRACNSAGCSGYTSVKRVSVPLPVPSVPGAISAPSTSTTGSYSVSWGSASGTVASYQLQERMNGGSWATVQNTTSRTKSFSKSAGRFFEYRVRACNSSGCGAYTFNKGVTIPAASVSVSVNTSLHVYIPASVTVDWISSMTTECRIFDQALPGSSGSTTINVPFSAWQQDPILSIWSISLVVTCDVIGGAQISSDPVTISATQYEQRPSVSVSWSNTEVLVGQNLTLSWSSTRADNCQLDGQSVGLHGSQSFNFSNPGTHSKTVTCENLGGEQSASASVVVSVPPATVTTFWSDSPVELGTPVTFSWLSSHADSCELDGRSVAPNGSESFIYSLVGSFSKTILCENAGSTAESSASLSVIAPVVEPGGSNPENDPVDGAEFYGHLRGEHSVNKSGAFEYSIPIDAPPGINGLQPDIRLSYNSAAQNGLVGWGWNISGLSVITRCPASLVRDGYASGISVGEEYKFCLDGQRLVQQPNGEYRTESESFKRITKVSNYWLVEHPDGSKSYYGFNNTNNAITSDAGGIPISWFMDKHADAAGNYIVYVYEPAAVGKTILIKEIQYTKSESGAQGTNNSIEFVYEDRDDVISHYAANTLFRTDKRLHRIEAKANGILVYSHTIGYQEVDGVDVADPVNTSRVVSVEKCYGSDAACAEPLTFEWTSTHQDNYILDVDDTEYVIEEDIAEHRYIIVEGGEGLFTRVVESGVYPIPASRGGRKPLLGHGVRGDFDGDNLLEVIWVDCENPDDETCDRKVAMSASDPGTTFVHTENFELFDPGLSGQVPPSEFLFGQSLDFNGDGLDDYYIKKIKSLDVYLSDGTTLEHSEEYSMSQSQLGVVYATACCNAALENVTKYWLYEFVLRDINGDGLVDILRMPKWDTYAHIATMSDLGITDISVAVNNGTGFNDFELWATSTDFILLNQIASSGYLNLVDVNGDQLVDLLGLDGQVGINTGTAFVADSSWRENINFLGFPPDVQVYVNAASVVTSFGPSSSGVESVPGYDEGQTAVRRFTSEFDPISRSTFMGDVNGDGLIDLLAVREAGIYVSLSDGTQFLPAEIWSTAITLYDVIPYCGMMECNTSRRDFVIQDANNDGMADVLFTRAWNGVWNQNASEVIALYSKGYRDTGGDGFSNPITIGSVAPFPDGTPLDIVWNQNVQRIGKPLVTEAGDLVVHLQPNFRDTEAYITMNIPLIEVIDVAMKVGVQKHKILAVHESLTRRLEVDYKALSDPEVYIQTGATDADSTLGHSTPNTYTFYGSDGQVSELPDHSVHSAARGQRIAASIGIYENDTLAAHESYFYKNRRSHRRGLGSLGFEEIQKTTTLAGQSQHLRTITEYLQEVGNEASYILAAPERTVNCVINALDAQGCESASGTTVLSEHTQNWQVRVYDNDSPRFHAYAVEEYTQNYDLHSGEQVNTISKRLYNDDVRSSCPALSSIDASNRAITTDVHFDAYGTPLDSVENRCDTFGVTGTHTDNDNVLNDTTNWCLNLTQDANVHRWIYDSGSDTTDSLTRHTHFTYLSSGAGKCQVDIETREPNGSNDIWLQQDYGYNAYGTRTSVQETVRHFTNDGIDFTQRTSSLTETYTSDGSRTMVTANAEGHSTTQTFNAAFGAVTRTLDANGLASDYYYDIAGRLDYSESLGVTTTYDYRSCDNCFTYNSNATHYVQEKTEGQSAQRVYFDDHNREVGKRWRGLNGDFYFTGQKYNALGQADTQIEPFAAGADTSALESIITYDVLGRPIDTHFASGAEQSVEYTVVDGAAAVITTDSLLHTKTQRYDALGREKSVQDALGTYVHYWHDALGSVNQVRVTAEAERETVTSDAVTHHIVFDALGRKTQLIDPDVGSLSYTYNAFGKLTEQINGEGERICYFYDRLDRQIQRRDNANGSCADGTVHTWTFDRPGELGLLAQVSGRDTANRVQSEVYDYTLDTLLPETVTSVIDGDSYTVTNIYDAFLRPAGVVYPTGFTVQPRYNDYGHAHEQVNAASGDVLWQASEDDARGNITLATFGNGAQVQSTFTAHNGLLATRVATLGATTLQNHTYSFDDEGNLRSRTDGRVNITQNFCYDPLYRLTDQVIGSACSDDLTGSYSGTAYAYDIHGNLTRKDGINDYHYGQSAQNAGPHAVSYANGGEYIYDDAGRMIGSPLGRTLTYSAFGKPTYMGIVGTYETKIIYGAMQRRVEREDYENGETTRTIYIGKQYERIDNPDGTREHRHYLGDWGIHVTEEDSSNNTESYNVYLTRDHIGSVASKSDDRSTPTVKYHANEPWGRRQNEAWNGVSYDTLSGAQLKDMTFGTTRGFTDHEHLDGIGLIHMNGRVYDPVIGRFVSPDPWIQDPENSQSFNRYSYVWNNPLRYTDPTGERTDERTCGRCTIIDFGSSSSQQVATAPTDVSSSQTQTPSGTPATTGANLESSNTEPAGEPAPTQGQGGTEAQQDLAANQTEQAGDVTETADNLGADTPEFNTENTGDDGEIESWDTIEDAREAAYKRLPYGDDVENEWGVVIYKKGEKFYLSDLIEGDKASVPFKFLQDTATGDAYTKEGHRIAEFAHTHPVKGLQENHLFSRKVSSSNLGDVGIAEDHNTPVSMRHKNTIRLYDPATERPAKDSFGFRNSPGKVICSGDCF